MDKSFIVDVRLEDSDEVLQLPVVRGKEGIQKELLASLTPRAQDLARTVVPRAEESLAKYLAHAGMYFGKDVSKWHPLGSPQVDVSEQDGKRIITKTGVYQGTELHLLARATYHDNRLPERPDTLHLDFSQETRAVTTDQQWQELIRDQPWTSGRRRRRLALYLQALLEAPGEELQLEGAHGLWELGINKEHHADISADTLAALVTGLSSPSVQVVTHCSAALWALGVSTHVRKLLEPQAELLPSLLAAIKRSTELPLALEGQSEGAGGKYGEATRNQMQACLLGALSVLMVDRACRKPLLALQPDLALLLQLCEEMPGYEIQAWAAGRREAAAKLLTSLVQRDAEVRMSLIRNGCLKRVLQLLSAQGPGAGQVRFCIAALLATLILDEPAMELIRERKEAPVLFEASLQMLTESMERIRSDLAAREQREQERGAKRIERALKRQQKAFEKAQKEAAAAVAAAGAAEGEGGAERAADADADADAAAAAEPGVPAAAPAVAPEAAEAKEAVKQQEGQEGEAGSNAEAAATDAAAAAEEEEEDVDEEAEAEQEAKDDEACDVELNNLRRLCEACAQAMWGSAHYSVMQEPLQIKLHHIVQLGSLGLDCVMLGALDMGRVGHSVCATLATLAHNHDCAAMMVGAVDGASDEGVLRSVLALAEVDEEELGDEAPHVRAAACTALAFLASHPLSARGDECMTGPYRERLLATGAFTALLRSALIAQAALADSGEVIQEDGPIALLNPNQIVMQAAAVGLMHLCTMAGTLPLTDLLMYSQLLTSTVNIQMVEYLMAGMWILVKDPDNRKALMASAEAVPGMFGSMAKQLKDVADVADVHQEATRLLDEKSPRPDSSGSRGDLSGRVRHLAAELSEQTEVYRRLPLSKGLGYHTSTKQLYAEEGSRQGALLSGLPLNDKLAGLDTLRQKRPLSGLGRQHSYASRVPLLDLSRAATAGPEGGIPSALPSPSALSSSRRQRGELLSSRLQRQEQPEQQQEQPEPVQQEGSEAVAAESSSEAVEGTTAEKSAARRARVKSSTEIKAELEEKLTAKPLGDNWGLDVLVRVGENWLPKLEAMSSEANDVDMPTLKLFEFLTASMCLYVVDEDLPSGREHLEVFHYSAPRGARNKTWWTVATGVGDPDTLADPLLQRALAVLLALLRLKTVKGWKCVQLAVVALHNAGARSAGLERHCVERGLCGSLLDIANADLWPPTVRDVAAGHLQGLLETYRNLRYLQEGAANISMALASLPGRDTSSPEPAAMALPIRRRHGVMGHDSAMGAAGAHGTKYWGYIPFLGCMVSLVQSGCPLLAIRGARGIARTCFQAPVGCSSERELLSEVKALVVRLGGIPALVDLLRGTNRRYLSKLDGVDQAAEGTTPRGVHSAAAAAAANESAGLHSEHVLYQRDMGTTEALYETYRYCLSALLNVSVLKDAQPVLARRGLPTLLGTLTLLQRCFAAHCEDADAESELLWLVSSVVQNLALHPDNRTRLYKMELQGGQALDRAVESELLEGATTADPAELLTTSGSSSATLRATSCSPRSPRTGGSPRSSGSPRTSSSKLPAISSPGGTAKLHTTGTFTGANKAGEFLTAAASLRPKALFPPLSAVGAGSPGGSPRSGSRSAALGASPKVGHGSPHATMTLPAGGVAEEAAAPAAAGGAATGAAVSPGGSPRKAQQQPPPSPPAGAQHPAAAGSAAAQQQQQGQRQQQQDSRAKFLDWAATTFPSSTSFAMQRTSPEPGTEAAASPTAAGSRGAGRRRVLDASGEWTEDPEASHSLNRLLCRPLSHMWHDTPVHAARRGNARWRPAITEYREVEGEAMMGRAAAHLMTTALPRGDTELMSASIRMPSGSGGDQALPPGTSSMVLPHTMTMQRPDDTERDLGRTALTVLQPRPDLVTTTLTRPLMTTELSSSGCVDATQPEPSQAPTQFTYHQLPSPQQSGQQKAEPARPGTPEATVPLKMVMAPQRARTVITFDERLQGPNDGSRAGVTMFEHVEGARVGEGLFEAYSLPNGKKAFMYYTAGPLVDEVEVEPVQPPPRPTTVPLALQQQMPLAGVLDIIAKPPGSAPPFIPYKPVPRLAPLPSRHTLKVRHPERMDASAFGDLQRTNLQLVLRVNRVTRTHTITTEEDVMKQPEREAWSLPASVFKSRAKECESHAYYDGDSVLDKMFEKDWQRAVGKEKFSSFMARENKGCKANKMDKVALQEVHDVLKAHYHQLYGAFVYYASLGSGDPYHMPLNAFTTFLEEAGVPDNDSPNVKRSDCDTIFIMCNFQPDKKSPDVAVNNENAMMRFEFLEALVRIGIAKYGKGQATDDIGTAVKMLFTENLQPLLPSPARVVPNTFRSERLYNEDVDLMVRPYLPALKVMYSRYRLKPPGGGTRHKVIRVDGWQQLMSDACLVDSSFTLSDATLCFLWSRMYVADEVKDYSRYTALSFTDFIEALGRVADMKPLPTRSDLDTAGYPDVLAWALDRERAEGGIPDNANTAAAGGASHSNSTPEAPPPPSPEADSGKVSRPVSALAAAAAEGELVRPASAAAACMPVGTGGYARPLYAKLEVLLDLMFRRLYWDPSQPESVYTMEALVRQLKKIDKEMGP